MSEVIKEGDRIKVHYRGTLDDGSEFDSSRNRPPLEFVVGSHQVIPGFEKALLGHKAGDSFTVTIPAADAYGSVREDLLFQVPKEQIPPTITPAPGLGLNMGLPNGDIDVVVKDVTETHIILDANHPLAGQNLTFELEVVDVAPHDQAVDVSTAE